MTYSTDTCFGGVYNGRKVLVTGHTGFKGSWLCAWLQKLGADVIGYSLAPDTTPNHFDLLNLDMDSRIEDIRDLGRMRQVVKETSPEIVFHLAAQPLVRKSYQQPIETLDANVMGTANVLEACRNKDSIRAIVCVTSDKVYYNYESLSGYAESARLGGADPYSCSKACSELIVDSYRRSFFSMENDSRALIASARAGNVIGGGDWAEDRIISDIVKSTALGQETNIRNPHAIRPWQHVLEPLSGYLLLGSQLCIGLTKTADAWNFGPDEQDPRTVQDVINEMKTHWSELRTKSNSEVNAPHETNVLRVNIEKAKSELNWNPIWNFQTTIRKVADWYKDFYEFETVRTHQHITDYMSDAYRVNSPWISCKEGMQA